MEFNEKMHYNLLLATVKGTLKGITNSFKENSTLKGIIDDLLTNELTELTNLINQL